MDEEIRLSLTLPLDSEGFLRRECPTCEREFKWKPGQEDAAESAAVPNGGYFCPYCAIQAPPDSWNTSAQVALVHSVVSREVINPMLDDFGRELDDIAHGSGGMLSVTSSGDPVDELTQLTELDDMRLVEFSCHVSEPVKVLEDWDRQVHCLICAVSLPAP